MYGLLNALVCLNVVNTTTTTVSLEGFIGIDNFEDWQWRIEYGVFFHPYVSYTLYEPIPRSLRVNITIKDLNEDVVYKARIALYNKFQNKTLHVTWVEFQTLSMRNDCPDACLNIMNVTATTGTLRGYSNLNHTKEWQWKVEWGPVFSPYKRHTPPLPVPLDGVFYAFLKKLEPNTSYGTRLSMHNINTNHSFTTLGLYFKTQC